MFQPPAFNEFVILVFYLFFFEQLDFVFIIFKKATLVG